MGGRVAVVMPFYSSINYIKSTMHTLLNQDHDNYRIFAVSDGSKEGMLDIMKEFEGRFPEKVRVLSQLNQGPGGALNTGFEAVNEEGGYDYGTMVSSSNLYQKNFLSALATALDHEPDDIVMTYGDFIYINENNVQMNTLIHKPVSKMDLVNGYDLGPAFMFRMWAKNKAGNYWRRICEDYNMAVRICEHGEVKLVPLVLMGYRVQPGQLTGSNPPEEQKAAEHSRRLAKKLYLGEDTKPEEVYPDGVDPYVHRRDEDALVET